MVVTVVVVVVGGVVVVVGGAVVVNRPPHWPAHVAGHNDSVNWLRQSVTVKANEAHTAWSVQAGAVLFVFVF